MSVLARTASLPVLQFKARRPSRHLPSLVNADQPYLSPPVFGTVLLEQDKRYEPLRATKIAKTLIRRFQSTPAVAMHSFAWTVVMIIVATKVTLFGIPLLDKNIGS